MATRQLATLVNAGVPLVEALTALVEQTEHRALKAVFARVRERVNEGSTLADALVSTGRFDNLYVSMVRAGEASGALDAVLVRIADYSEDSVRLNNRVLLDPDLSALHAGLRGRRRRRHGDPRAAPDHASC